METKLEPRGPLAWELDLAISGEQIDAEVQRRLVELRPRLRVPGFRPGKAPLSVLRRHHGPRLRQQQWARSAQAEVRRELAERGLQPVLAPRLEPIAEGQAVRARFEVLPELPASDLAQLTIRRPMVAPEEADVDYMIERVREQHRSWKPSGRPAAAGDRVEVDVVASAAGWRWPKKGRRRVEQIVEGAGPLDFLGGSLVGCHRGDTLALEATPPPGNPLAPGAATEVSLQLVIRAVLTSSLPALDADFVRRCGVADGEISSLRSELRSAIASEVAEAVEEEIARAVEEALLGALPRFELPPSLVEAQRESLRRAQEGAGGGSVEQLEGEAARLLRTTIAWAHAARQLGVRPDPTALWKETEALAATTRDPQEELDRIWEDAGEIQEIEDRLLRRRVVEAVLATARVEEETTSFRELARRRQQRTRESAEPETS